MVEWLTSPQSCPPPSCQIALHPFGDFNRLGRGVTKPFTLTTGPKISS
jgi:hypothetical protein